MPILFWESESRRAVPAENLYFTKKVGGSLAIVLASYDVTGSRTTAVLFAGDDATEVTRAWHEFVKVKCYGSDTDNETEEIHLNTRCMEVLRMFQEQYRVATPVAG